MYARVSTPRDRSRNATHRPPHRPSRLPRRRRSRDGQEVQSITVCGVDGCATSNDAELMSGMIDIGPPTSAPKAPAPFYRLTAGLAALPSAQLPGFPTADANVTPPRPAPSVTSSNVPPIVPVVAGRDALRADRTAGAPARGQGPPIEGPSLCGIAARARPPGSEGRAPHPRRQQLLGAGSLLNRAAM